MQDELPRGSRRAIRRAVELDCEIVAAHMDDPLGFRMGDLSPFGIWIPTAEPLRTGQVVVACFEPCRGWELMVFAEVARVTTSRRPLEQPGVGMALELLDLTVEQHERLTHWLSDKRAPVPRRRRPVPRSAWRVPVPTQHARAFRPLVSAWR